MHNWGVALLRVTPFFKFKIENIECRKFVETRQCILQKNKETLIRLMEIGDVLFFETCQCVLWHVALTRLYRERIFFYTLR